VTIIRNKVIEDETLFNALRQKRLQSSATTLQRDLYVFSFSIISLAKYLKL